MTTLSKIKLPMPRLGETMDKGTIANWLVKPGEAFKRGDALLELETDKTLVEYPALGSGTLLETLAEPGDIIAVGSPIAVIETEDTWDGISDADEKAVETTSAPAPADEKAPPTQSAAASEKLRATPLARRLARQAEIDLETIAGSGRRGRIEARDVEAAAGLSMPPVIARQSGSKPSHVFFVHGFAGAASNWTSIRASLKRNGIASTAMDMPGHGRNPVDALSVNDLVMWLTDQLRALDEPVHLVGHSLGAHVATLSASKASDQIEKLTLIAPAGCGHEINGGFIHGMANASSAGELAHLMRLLGPKATALNGEALEAMAQDLGKGLLKQLAADMARGDAQQIDTISALRSLSESLPVTAIFGAADVIIPKEHVFNMPPHVACHIIRGGHMPQWDSPGLVERLITRTI